MTSDDDRIEEIDALRAEGRYADALRVARERVASWREPPTTTPFERTDAERLVATLAHILDLPEVARVELTRADQIARELARLQARQAYEEVLPLAEAQLSVRERWLGRDHEETCTTLDYLVLANAYCAHPEVAEPMAHEVLATRRRTLEPGHPAVGDAAGNVGLVLSVAGRAEDALPYFREAVLCYREAFGDHPRTRMGLRNLAATLARAGRYVDAEAPMWEALAMARRTGEPDAVVADILVRLGVMFDRLRECARGKELILEALPLLENDPERFPNSHAEALRELGMVAGIEKDVEAARDWHERSVRFALEHHGESSAQLRGALLYQASTLCTLDDPGAEAALERCLELSARLSGPDSDHLEYPTHLLGQLKRKLGDVKQAEELLRRAIVLAGHSRSRRYDGAVALADLCATTGRAEEACTLLRDQVAAYESLRAEVKPGLARATTTQEPYSRLAHLALLSGHGAEAWSLAERAVGRVTAELVLSPEWRGMTSSDADRDAELRRRYRRLESQQAALQEATSEASTDDARKLAAALAQIRAEHERLLAEARVGAPQHPTEPHDLSRILSSLRPTMAIVGWLELDIGDPDGVVAWGYVLRADRDVFWAQLSGQRPQGSLYATIGQLGGVLGVTGDATSVAEAREWWRQRFAPLHPALDGVEHVVVIAPGAMTFAPVDALVDDAGGLLADRFASSYTPSATILSHLSETRRQRNVRRALLVGDPPLRDDHGGAAGSTRGRPREARAVDPGTLRALPRLTGSRKEVESISRLFADPHVLVGEEATERRLVELADGDELRRFDVLHFATHAVANEQIPERSALVLSQLDRTDPLDAVLTGDRAYRGLVTAGEIARDWRLDAELVTLSACSTGRGREVHGEGLVSFAHAFLVAGARSVIVSLWPVDDRATALLLGRFYEHWLEPEGAPGATKVEALRIAKRWLREYRDEHGGRPYAHPFYWAPFLLFGDPS